MSDNELRERLKKDQYYKNLVNELDLHIISMRLTNYARSKNIDYPLRKSMTHHTAEIIKVLKNHSGRALAEVAYPEDHNNHGIQMAGRDLKRWAAIVLDEIFSEKIRDTDGNYWHEN